MLAKPKRDFDVRVGFLPLYPWMIPGVGKITSDTAKAGKYKNVRSTKFRTPSSYD